MLFFKGHKYALVEEDDQKGDEKSDEGFRPWLRRLVFSLLVVSVLLFVGRVGFVLGKRASGLENISSALELEKVARSFRYNISFTEAPSPHTDQSWRDLFPIDGGFFVHPVVAPTRATFSSFHQLHCLDGIRGAYWASHRTAIRGGKLNETELPMDMQPRHVRHCIDLLRQSLMCHADTTVEVVDETIGGVHGFRVEHQCRNWDQLVQWTSEQQIKYKGRNRGPMSMSD